MTPTERNTKYRKEKTKVIFVRIFPKDMDVYEYIQKQPQKAKYIIDLIRKEMDGK